MEDIDRELSGEAEVCVRLFEKSLPLQVQLQETVKFAEIRREEVCLDVGADNPMISYYLRRKGGSWQSAVLDDSMAETAAAILGEDVKVLDGSGLPFDDKTFDVVVLLGNTLESVESDYSFIEECNRVLKPTGRLVVHINRRKLFSIAGVMEKIFGQDFRSRGRKRSGYTEQELFFILKDGFDVHHVHTYTRLFVRLTDIFFGFMRGRAAPVEADDGRSLLKVAAVANVFYRIADQFDMLLFLSKGFRLMAGAKRRMWRSRNAPILKDGRTISEAVLSKPGN